MNLFAFNLKHKKKILGYLDKGDILGLRKYIDANGLSGNDFFYDLIGNFYNLSPFLVFGLFDEKGKLQLREDISNYLGMPRLIELFYKNDPSIIDKLPQGYYKFVQYCNTYKDVDDSEFLAKAMSRYVFAYDKDMSEMFDGKSLSPKFYDWICKDYYSIINLYNCSNKIKKHFTPFETRLVEGLEFGSHDELKHLFSELDRKDLPKCFKLIKDGAWFKAELVLNDKTAKHILQSPILKELLSPNLFTTEKGRAELKKYFDDLEIGYLKNASFLLSTYFIGKENFDMHDYFSTRDGKIFANSRLINELLEDDDYLRLYNIVLNYCDEESISKLETNDKNLNFQNIRRIFLMLNSISKDNEDLWKFVKQIIKNLPRDNSFLMLDVNKLDFLKDLILDLQKRTKNSNSKELKKFCGQIIASILNGGKGLDYESTLTKIEDVFSRNNVPTFAKRYLVFKILNPDLSIKIPEEEKNDQRMSPTLIAASNEERYQIVYNDLFRCTIGSNNISFRKYLENIGKGNDLYLAITSGKIKVSELNETQKAVLTEFANHLLTLHRYSKEGENSDLTLTGNIEEDLKMLIPLFKANERYSLPDRIIRMYGYFAGFKSYEQAVNYINDVRDKATQRGKELSKKKLVLEKGDMIKGIGKVGVEHLFDILQNGSLAKEFLGVDASHDTTPLDTDLSLITKDSRSIKDGIEKTLSTGLGPVFFGIKNGKYQLTRSNVHQPGESTTKGPECFKTLGDGHVGIRTGFPSSDIDYIVIDSEGHEKGERSLKEEVALSIALSGIYIPVVDMKTEKVVYTYEEFQEQRKRMAGLPHYGEDKYVVSDNLYVPEDFNNQELIDDSTRKRNAINKTISERLKEDFNLGFNSKLEKDITPGSVDLIDTGSTSRGTNASVASDFDFIMRVDEKADRKAITTSILSSFGMTYEEALESEMIIGNGNLRLKGVRVPGVDEPMEIDISFVSKADEVEYTTDMSLKERLESIKEQYPDKYEQVLDNIIFAKKFMKESGCYKPNHARGSNDGGMGGVGIENWVLQNGGSFYDACMDFYEKATVNGSAISFEEFKKIYKVYDFGTNFYTGKRDEFISDNMTAAGYRRMYKAVSNYIKKYKEKYNSSKKEEEKKSSVAQTPIMHNYDEEETLDSGKTK